MKKITAIIILSVILIVSYCSCISRPHGNTRVITGTVSSYCQYPGVNFTMIYLDDNTQLEILSCDVLGIGYTYKFIVDSDDVIINYTRVTSEQNNPTGNKINTSNRRR